VFFRDTRAGGGHAATLGGGCEPGSASRGRRGGAPTERRDAVPAGAPAGDRPTAVAQRRDWFGVQSSTQQRPNVTGVSRRSQGTNAGLVQPPAGAWRATETAAAAWGGVDATMRRRRIERSVGAERQRATAAETAPVRTHPGPPHRRRHKGGASRRHHSAAAAAPAPGRRRESVSAAAQSPLLTGPELLVPPPVVVAVAVPLLVPLNAASTWHCTSSPHSTMIWDSDSAAVA